MESSNKVTNQASILLVIGACRRPGRCPSSRRWWTLGAFAGDFFLGLGTVMEFISITGVRSNGSHRLVCWMTRISPCFGGHTSGLAGLDKGFLTKCWFSELKSDPTCNQCNQQKGGFAIQSAQTTLEQNGCLRFLVQHPELTDSSKR